MTNQEYLYQFNSVESISKIANRYKLPYKELSNILHGYGSTSKYIAARLNEAYRTDVFREDYYDKQSQKYLPVSNIINMSKTNEVDYRDAEIARLKEIINELLRLI